MGNELMTVEQIEALRKLEAEDVMSVYSGKAGRCCCGCSGSHRYAKRHRYVASKHRGYKVQDDEVNDVQVKRVLGILQRNAKAAHGGDSYFAVEIGERLYIVYPLPAGAYVHAEAKANAPSNVARYM